MRFILERPGLTRGVDQRLARRIEGFADVSNRNDFIDRMIAFSRVVITEDSDDTEEDEESARPARRQRVDRV
jgi:hypothetical protein